MKNILFVSYGGGHVSNLLPVYEEVSRFSSINATFLALTTAQAYLDRFGVNYIGYKDFPFELPSENKENAVILLNQLQNQPISPEESLAYLGWNMWDLEQQYGKKAACEKYKGFGRAAFYPINLMKMMLEAYSIDMVVTTSSPRSEKAAIYAARDLGISSVCVPDIGVNLDLCGWIADTNFANRLCVATSNIKEKITALKRNPDSIAVTGSPAVETFSQPLTPEERLIFKERLNIDKNRSIILYAPSPEYSKNTFSGEAANENLPKEILETICSCFANQNEYHLIFRPHPNQNFHFERSSIHNITFDEGYDLKSIISISDVIVTTASTVGILAQVLEKPLIAISLSVHYKEIDYSDFGDFTCVSSLDAINSAIKSILSQEPKMHPSKTAARFFKNSTENISDQIRNILGE